MEINDRHPRENKSYSFRALPRESATVTCVLAATQAGREVGRLYLGKRGRLQGCPDGSHGEARGG